jgi:hypothetical protein
MPPVQFAMALDNTITEQDMDAASQQFVRGFRDDNKDFEPDLAVDGLSDSVVSRFIRLITFGRA